MPEGNECRPQAEESTRIAVDVTFTEHRPDDKKEAEQAAQKKREISPVMLTILGGIGAAMGALWNLYQAQELEKTKLRASLIQKALEQDTAQKRKDLLTFMVTAGLISDEGGKIGRLTKEEIPEVATQFSFSKSSVLSPEQKKTLDRRLIDFQDYLRKLGLKAEGNPQVDVRPEDKMDHPGLCYYDFASEPGKLQLVINSRYAEDSDLVLREYCNYVLVNERPQGPPNYDQQWETYWPHFSMESALAYYLPCSFNREPQFAHITGELGSPVPLPRLDGTQKVTDLEASLEAVYYKNAEIWGSIFWELRTLLGREKIDGLLINAWFTLNEKGSPEQQSKAFAKALRDLAEKRLDAGAAEKITNTLLKRGVSP